MCNCNNPATKATIVTALCNEAGGQDLYGVFYGLDQIQQHMVF